MKFHPKVSIVIPVYNGSNYLREAIDSALAQTYDNIEILVINDGSNDGGATEKIAKSYGNKIRYYAKENGGVATALNLGIEKMTGEYFSWLSHDDLYYPDKIEKQVTYLSGLKDKKVFLYANYSLLIDGEVTPVVHNHEMLTRKSKYSLLRGCVNGITILVPKSIFNEMGKFDATLRCTQDYEYWRRIEAKYPFIHMENVLSVTRLHSAQDSVVSPNVITEGNTLWINMVKNLTTSEMIQLEGTVYNFYLEMVAFLKTTPYGGALAYCEDELVKAELELKRSTFNPKVSIIIPFYNRLDKTLISLKSAINQTYENKEILLIDDGSTEDSTTIKKYIKNKKNIKLISLVTNQGPAAARNVGINSAEGEYIAFLDSDDEFIKDKLDKQISIMKKFNRDISYTAYTRRDSRSETLVADPSLTGIIVPNAIRGCTVATPTVIIRKSLLTNNDIYFNETLRIGEDTCFWLEIAKISEFKFINEPLTVVNVDDNTHSQDYPKLIQGIQNILTYLLNDEYYSKFSYDISFLTEYFYKINQEAATQLDIRLRDKSYLNIKHTQPHIQTKSIKESIKKTTTYKAVRVLYKKGPRATLSVAKKRIKRK